MSTTVNNRLRVLRAIHGWTQAELAERIGASRRSINAIESGSMLPSVLLALKLARALQCPVEQIFSLASESDERTSGTDLA